MKIASSWFQQNKACTKLLVRLKEGPASDGEEGSTDDFYRWIHRSPPCCWWVKTELLYKVMTDKSSKMVHLQLRAQFHGKSDFIPHQNDNLLWFSMCYNFVLVFYCTGWVGCWQFSSVWLCTLAWAPLFIKGSAEDAICSCYCILTRRNVAWPTSHSGHGNCMPPVTAPVQLTTRMARS